MIASTPGQVYLSLGVLVVEAMAPSAGVLALGPGPNTLGVLVIIGALVFGGSFYGLRQLFRRRSGEVREIARVPPADDLGTLAVARHLGAPVAHLLARGVAGAG